MPGDSFAIGTDTFLGHMQELAPVNQVQSRFQLSGNSKLERFLISELSGRLSCGCYLSDALDPHL